MDGAQVESIELDEQSWKRWVEKGRLQDRLRKRRWRVIGSVAAAVVFASAVYEWIVAI